MFKSVKRYVSVLPMVACAAAGMSFASASLAEEAWPTRPLRMVISFAPGGGADTAARIVAKALSEKLGQSIVIENRPGGGGTVGVASALREPADGYTLIWCSPAAEYLAPADLPYKPFVDLAPVSTVTSATFLLVANPNQPYKNLPEMIAAAKAEPEAINYGTAGAFGHGRMMGEYMKQLADFEMQPIPFQGEGPAVAAIMAGDVQVGFISSPASWPLVQSGKLVALANTTKTEFPGIPKSIAPVSDTIPGYDVTAFNYLSMRAGTPRHIIDKASEALREVLAQADVKEQMATFGVVVNGSTPEELGERLQTEYKQWRGVMIQAGIADR